MKKLLLFGLLWWVLIFVEVSIIGFTPGFATMGDNGFTLLPMGIAIHFFLLAIFSAVLGKLYFSKKPFASQNALVAAATIVLIGLLLDALITVPFFVKSYSVYFSKWTLWTGVGVFIGVFYCIGKFKNRHDNSFERTG